MSIKSFVLTFDGGCLCLLCADSARHLSLHALFRVALRPHQVEVIHATSGHLPLHGGEQALAHADTVREELAVDGGQCPRHLPGPATGTVSRPQVEELRTAVGHVAQGTRDGSGQLEVAGIGERPEGAEVRGGDGVGASKRLVLQALQCSSWADGLDDGASVEPAHARRTCGLSPVGVCRA